MSWTELVGHEPILERLRHALAIGRLGHAFLFVGESGIGKRRLALELAQGLLCRHRPTRELAPCGTCADCVQVAASTHPDVTQIAKPADKHELPVQLIHGLCGSLGLKAARGGHKIAIVDDADLLTVESSNCFLKTLEEPPPQSVLILLATSLESQLKTIVSRCQVMHFRSLTDAQVVSVLTSLELAPDEDEARRMALWGNGSVGRAIQFSSDEWQLVRRLLHDHLSEKPLPSGTLTREVQQFIDEAGKEAAARRERSRDVIRMAADFYRDCLRYQQAGMVHARDSDRAAVEQAAQLFDAETLLDLMERCLQADFHIGRFLNQSLAVDCWIDDLAQLSAGHYVEPIN
ncbi:DNA polymerase III subunit tau [Planctomycetes bacterium Pan216]|uniref:DNA polymerase III subunit tau n=1 Tax=Kolteria novifilia TaxID=2527975 RepID=A0A518BA34_9BACT|nr:DNA polymerase III subunit tau [Planctomycetes bacterium Pan216]